eukprot:10754202-Prorocentrum_lima.AAC.1
MTSSLVGSEMCIRDSIKARESTIGTSFLFPELGRRGLDRGVEYKCVAKAVSYTHLTLPTICSV